MSHVGPQLARNTYHPVCSFGALRNEFGPWFWACLASISGSRKRKLGQGPPSQSAFHRVARRATWPLGKPRTFGPPGTRAGIPRV